MDDVKRALLGDRKAAKRLTEAGGASAVPVVWEDGSSRWDDSGA